MAIVALPGFNDLGRSVFFFLMDHFLYLFLAKKNEEHLSTRRLKFLQYAPSKSVLVNRCHAPLRNL